MFLNGLHIFVWVLLFGILLAFFVSNNCAHFLGLIKKLFFNIFFENKGYFFSKLRGYV